MRATLLVAALAAALLLGLGGAAAAPGVRGGPPKAKPRTEDIPFIRCQVCELLAKNAWKQVKELLKSASPTNQVDEMKVIELMEKITTAWRPEGEWIARLDLVEQGDRLVVQEMEQLGVCGVECKTVERAAEQIMGEHDTDIAEALFTGKKSRAQFSNWLCYELSGACKHKPPPLPKDRAPGPAFQPQQEGEQNLERMVGEMQDQGLRGSLFSRDEIMAKYGLQEGDDNEDEEDEEEEAGWPEEPPYPPAAPMEQLLHQVRGAANTAAAAAARGLKAAEGAVRGLWAKLSAGRQQTQKQEL